MATELKETIITYRIFDIELAVLSESPQMAEHINCFMKCLAPADGEQGTPSVRLMIFRTPGRELIMCCPEVGMAKKEVTGRPAWVAFRRLFMHLALDADRSH